MKVTFISGEWIRGLYTFFYSFCKLFRIFLIYIEIEIWQIYIINMNFENDF